MALNSGEWFLQGFPLVLILPSRAFGQHRYRRVPTYRCIRISGANSLDGEIAGAKAGRGSANEIPFVAAIAVNKLERPILLKLSAVEKFALDAVENRVKRTFSQGAPVISDELICFTCVTDAGCIHRPLLVGRFKPSNLPQFKWIETIRGNLTSSRERAHRAFGFRKYAARLLTVLAHRFSHRFDLASLVNWGLVDNNRVQAAPQRVIRKAEDYCLL